MLINKTNEMDVLLKQNIKEYISISRISQMAEDSKWSNYDFTKIPVQ